MAVLARIQHHPARAHLLPALTEALAPLPVEIVTHSSDPPSPWGGYQLCLRGLPEEGHVVVIQDDAKPVPGFGVAVQQIALRWPDTPVCLFLARLPRRTSSDATKALKAGHRYSPVFFRDFCPVVAMLWPTHKARELLEWGKTAKLPGNSRPRSDDAVVGRWMAVTKQRIMVTCPSIVQHPDCEPSLIGRRAAWGRDSGRVALHLATDAADYEW